MSESPNPRSSTDSPFPATSAAESSNTLRIVGFSIVAVLAVVGWVREVNSDHRHSDQWALCMISWAFAFVAPIVTTYCIWRILQQLGLRR